MKSPTHLKLVVPALLAALSVSSHAQTAEVILPGSPYAPAATGNSVLINPFDGGPAPGVLLATGDAGAGNPVLFRVTPTDASSSQFNIEPVDAGFSGIASLGHNRGDGIYAVGRSPLQTSRRSSVDVWKTRKSRDGDQGNPNTWQDEDTFYFAGKIKGSTQVYGSAARGICANNAGNVFVCGRAYDGQVNHWVIRRRSTAGAWATVYDAKAADDYSLPYRMCFVPQGGNNPVAALFVVGILNDRWTVLRSQDQGASWQTVGPWPADGSLASANDVASDSLGNVYVVGVRGRDSQNRGWVVRRSSDGGQNWETLLDQPSQLDSWTYNLVIDANDTITVSGAIDGANGYPHCAVVRNRPGQAWEGAPSASWETRSFPLGQSTADWSNGRGMAVDAVGNVFLTGDLIDWTDPEDGTHYSGPRLGLLRLVP